MSAALTFTTASERTPTIIASLVFLLPGCGAVIVGVLTMAGLSWIENASNGVLLVTTGSIWATVGFALLRFKRWITVDPEAGTVVQGTRTLFRHPGDRQPLAAFSSVDVFGQAVGDQRFYVVGLKWDPEQRPRSRAHEAVLWLESTADLSEARQLGKSVSEKLNKPFIDRTKSSA